MGVELSILNRNTRPEVNGSPCVIDIFSGAGGLSLGFSDAGFTTLFAVERLQEIATSYSENHNSTPVVVEDISKLDPLETLSVLGHRPSEIDGVIGGPPCQGFSSVGNRRLDDDRNALSWSFVLWVSKVLPKFFVMENVTGILSMKRGEVKKEIVERFEGLGYRTEVKRLLSANFGVPQMRRRFFFVGTKEGADIAIDPSHFRNMSQMSLSGRQIRSYVTVRDAIDDLPALEVGVKAKDEGYAARPKSEYQKTMREGSNELTLHIFPKHSPLVLERIKNIPQGGDHSILPQALRLQSGYRNIYGRLTWDKPADTITGNCGCVSAPGRFIHPRDNRAITVREAARLQSFPDRCNFHGNLTSMYRQIGNAVPPLLAKAVAMGVRRWLESREK